MTDQPKAEDEVVFTSFEPVAARSPTKLDLGSGLHPAPGFTGVDRIRGEGIITFDLASSEPWPFESGSIDALRSSHLIEHIPTHPLDGRDRLVRFFEEAYRVCRPEALFELRWPAPFHPETGMPMPSAWWDPTHYRFIPAQTIPLYFSKKHRESFGVGDYDIQCNWSPARDISWRTLNLDGTIIEYEVLLRKEPL